MNSEQLRILCGQSFGSAVARSLALQLDSAGFSLRGLVALDPRCVDATAIEVQGLGFRV